MMIKIICSAQAYTYNAYHIVKAFYPAVEITNHVEEKASNYVEINFSDGQVIAVEKEEIKAETDAEKKAQTDKACDEKAGRRHGIGSVCFMVPTDLSGQRRKSKIGMGDCRARKEAFRPVGL